MKVLRKLKYWYMFFKTHFWAMEHDPDNYAKHMRELEAQYEADSIIRDARRLKSKFKYDGKIWDFYEITPRGGLRLTAKGIALIKEERVRQKNQQKEELPIIASNLVSGELSGNVNWSGIEEVGNYLSPIGNDKKHLVVIYNRKKKRVASIKCTNELYSEWIVCLCETMWHTKQKVLEDIHGNKYAVGDMCEYTCETRYI